jgi:asparagine synthase (glutamine-hydrolysing)
MAEIFGWLGPVGSGQDPQATLQRMAQGAARRDDLRVAVCEPELALACSGPLADSFVNDHLAIAVDGTFSTTGAAANGSNAKPAARLAQLWTGDANKLAQQLRGRFAFVLIDRRARRAVCAVDRLGGRPLAFARPAAAGTNNGQLAFGSSATSVAEHPWGGKDISLQAVFDFAWFHMVPSPGTVFRGVEKLGPATTLDTARAAAAPARYWAPTFATSSARNETDQAQAFLASLRAAVKRAAPDEAAVGSYLSGGIDSSTVTGLIAETRGRGKPAFTVGFAEAGYDETNYSKIASEHFGAALKVHYISPEEVAAAMPVIASLYDEPFGNASAIPSYVCAKQAASAGVQVMLAGDGGDELFGGNTRYAKQGVFEHFWRLPQFGRTALTRWAEGRSDEAGLLPVRKLASYVKQARLPMPERIDSYNFVHRETPGRVFTKDFVAAVDTAHPFALLRERYGQAEARALVDRMLYLDWKFTLADNDMRKVVRTAEHAGIHVEFPWLDDGVLDLSTTLPADWKVRDGRLRYFAKRALTGFLPDAIINKSKHGFGLPFGEWLKKFPVLQERTYELLGELKRRRWLQAEFIDELIERHRGGHAAYYGTMVWVFAMLELWLEEHDIGA